MLECDPGFLPSSKRECNKMGQLTRASSLQCEPKCLTLPCKTYQEKNLTFLWILILPNSEKTDSPMGEGSLSLWKKELCENPSKRYTLKSFLLGLNATASSKEKSEAASITFISDNRQRNPNEKESELPNQTKNLTQHIF